MKKFKVMLVSLTILKLEASITILADDPDNAIERAKACMANPLTWRVVRMEQLSC